MRATSVLSSSASYYTRNLYSRFSFPLSKYFQTLNFAMDNTNRAQSSSSCSNTRLVFLNHLRVLYFSFFLSWYYLVISKIGYFSYLDAGGCSFYISTTSLCFLGNCIYSTTSFVFFNLEVLMFIYFLTLLDVWKRLVIYNHLIIYVDVGSCCLVLQELFILFIRKHTKTHTHKGCDSSENSF